MKNTSKALHTEYKHLSHGKFNLDRCLCIYEKSKSSMYSADPGIYAEGRLWSEQNSIIETNRREFEHYKQIMVKTRTRYQIISQENKKMVLSLFVFANSTTTRRMSANTSSKQRSRLLLGGCFLLKCRFVQNVHLALKRNI